PIVQTSATNDVGSEALAATLIAVVSSHDVKITVSAKALSRCFLQWLKGCVARGKSCPYELSDCGMLIAEVISCAPEQAPTDVGIGPHRMDRETCKRPEM